MTENMLAIYQAAVDELPPLTRLVFLLHRVDDLSCRQIADRLAVTSRAVECCLAEALVMIDEFLNGDTPRRWRREPLAQAEVALRQRHRIYCERRLRSLRIRIAWDDNGDDDQAVSQNHAASHAATAPRNLLASPQASDPRTDGKQNEHISMGCAMADAMRRCIFHNTTQDVRAMALLVGIAPLTAFSRQAMARK